LTHVEPGLSLLPLVDAVHKIIPLVFVFGSVQINLSFPQPLQQAEQVLEFGKKGPVAFFVRLFLYGELGILFS
jgi:hypothetical protein